MSALVDGQCIEAEIAECCRDIYWATEPGIAMSKWARLRELRALQAEAEKKLFALETVRRSAG